MLIAGSFPPMKCGIGDYTACLAEALGKYPFGIEAVAVLTHTNARPVPLHFNFEVLPLVQGWRISEILRIVNIIRRWRPEIVHIQYPGQGYGRRWLPWLLPILLTSLGIHVVQTWHEYCTGRWRYLCNAIAPGGLVVVRPNYKQHMSSSYRWLTRHKRFRFIPNASIFPIVNLRDTERQAIRAQFADGDSSLIVFLGFVYPAKGLESLFEIADPARHNLTLICDLNPADPYHKLILDRMSDEAWAGRVKAIGFLPAAEVSRIVAAADAVVLPFREGGGKWNSSIHGALAQGTFVLTTSREQHGYDSLENIYYAYLGDVVDMRRALDTYLGCRNIRLPERPRIDEWDLIADKHIHLYRTLLD